MFELCLHLPHDSDLSAAWGVLSVEMHLADGLAENHSPLRISVLLEHPDHSSPAKGDG